MKTQLTLLALLFTLLVSAQEKHSISTFNTKYTKVPNYPITQIEGGTEYAIDVTLEFGKESKLKPQIEALELYNQKKTSKADLIFAITVKEPEALIEEKKKEDGTYFYTYEYSTTCLVEAKKGGKVVDTVPYKIKGEKIKTISAAPITIVDKYVKSPVFKIKANKAKTKSIAKALKQLSSLLSDEYSYYTSYITLTYNQYVDGAQGSTSDYTELNALYNDYKKIAEKYLSDREGSKTKLNEILTRADKLINKKQDNGRHYFNFMELHHLMVLKLQIYTLQYNFEEANKVAEELNADKKGLKTSQSKTSIENLKKFEASYIAAKASGIDFKY